ncbi:MAG TPA: long-chain fatty acid--CoA ligase [Planctomycetota bacterium]|nr:long-chain fatty acid--CoA ligase [Planctomycetota bacterium]
MSLNLSSIVQCSNRYFRAETALIDGDVRLSYRDLAREVEGFAAYLAGLGLVPGDKVAILLPNRMSFTIAYFGILHAGLTVVPVSFLSVEREIEHVLKDSEASALIAWSAYERQARAAREAVPGCTRFILVSERAGPLTIEEGPPRDPALTLDLRATEPGDTAVIIYTSGTTGEPKGAELTHFNLYSNAQFCADRIFYDGSTFQTLGPGNVLLAALPLFHSFGQTCNQNAAILAGGALTYIERFDARSALEVMERDRVTLFAGVPTMYFQILNLPGAERYDLSSLKYCSSGGAAMPLEVMKDFEDRHHVDILEGYGLSETSPVATFNALWRPRKPGSIGQAIPGVEVKIFDDQDREVPRGEVGEVVIRGYNVMKGYYRRPEATRKAFSSGWFHSGDMGRMDDESYAYIVDRKKDLIIRGGFNVYPREVEEVLYAHPAVREAAVVGVPSLEYGEEVKAFLSFKAGETATEEEISAFCRKNLGATKYPRVFEVLADLPKGPTGKILRKELRARGES